MRKVNLSIVLVALAVIGFVSYVGAVWPHQLMMRNMMGHMMGDSAFWMGLGMWFWPTTLLAAFGAAVAVIGYYLLLPEIKSPQPSETKPPKDVIDVVLRISKPDEAKVLKVLWESGGKALQRDITKKAGFSKLKTHRVIARLAERGLVMVTKQGKTNDITLAQWLLGTGERPTEEEEGRLVVRDVPSPADIAGAINIKFNVRKAREFVKEARAESKAEAESSVGRRER